jgi:thiol:disulfide interchange protein
MTYIEDLGLRAKKASTELNRIESNTKDKFFEKLIENLDKNREIIKERSEGSQVSINDKGAIPETSIEKNEEKFLKLPFVGKVDVYKVSIPVLAITMGILDGFNPCAMWVLLFLISMLIGMGDRKRMWTIGTTFIVSSALVYFVFMAAWLNLIIFLGFVAIIRIIIGLLALFGGGFESLQLHDL